VLYSTGTRTNVHYNLQLGGETALMVKERFIELYDDPIYTVAIGGSGGAIQQYVYAQNHPGLLDGGIPQYSYPDMVTQAIHIGDCELTEFFFDVIEGPFGPGPGQHRSGRPGPTARSSRGWPRATRCPTCISAARSD
jgi:hypothetical protein